MNVLKNRLSFWLVNYWQEFDNAYMKKRLVHDWPNCRIQNEELSERITDLADEYSEEFKKREQEPIQHQNQQNSNNINDINDINDFEMKNISGIRNNLKEAFNQKKF